MQPEIEEGNIEYKRCLHIDTNRIEENISQMKWRVKEGNGEAIYYLGIENDGSFYNWSDKEKNQTLNAIKIIINKANLKLIKIEKIKYDTNNYFKVIIREREKLFPEKRILLLGSSSIGKSTFLANIILSRLDENNKEARMYLFSHKHEMVQKKTSSYNYVYLNYNNIKWVFIEAPGEDKYIKTRNKIISAFGSSIDYCLFFEKDKWLWKDYYVDYFNKIGIPYININLYETDKISFPNYNTKNLIDKNDFFNNLINLCTNRIAKDTCNKNLEFIVLQSFVNNDIGVILTGILKSGELNIDKKYYLHLTNINEIKIKSIHLDGKPFNRINGPRTISICIEKIENIKDYIGIISNNQLNKINNFKIESYDKNLLIYKDNKVMNQYDYKKYYQTNDKIFLVSNGNGFNI